MTKQQIIKLNNQYNTLARFIVSKMNKFIFNKRYEELAQWKQSYEYKMLETKSKSLFNQLMKRI